MASKFGLAGGIPERRVRPIWDAVDSRQFKAALKQSAILLAKYPNSPYALALKALILERMGKQDEALSVCLNAKELLCSNNVLHIDDLTLSTLQIVFQRLDRLDLATSCYEHACAKYPNNLEIMMGLFNCYVREYSFVKQQQTAIKMYKIVGEERFLLWAVCSIQLQVLCSSGGEKLLTLAEALLKKHVASHSLHEPEALLVYISILEQQAKYDAALDILTGNLGSLIGIEEDKLRMQGRLLARACNYAAAAEVFQKVLESCPDDWGSFLHYLGCLLEDDMNWSETSTTNQLCSSSSADIKACTVTHLTEEVFDLRISSALSFVKKLQMDVSNDGVRGPYLANVEVERQRRLNGKADEKYMEALLNYFYRFSHLPCFTSDVEIFFRVLTENEKAELLEKFETASKSTSSSPIKALGQAVTIFKIKVLFGAMFVLPIRELEGTAIRMVEMFRENLILSRDLDPQENMHGEELLSMASSSLVLLFWRTRKVRYLLEAILVLEFGLNIRRFVWQYKMPLLHLYSQLGALPLAYEWYGTLEVKNILLECLFHHILPQMLESPLLLETSDLLKDYLKFMDDHLREAADLTFLAYRHRNYSKVIEFVQFKERLQHSNQFLMAKVEASILQLKQKDSLEEVEGILEKVDFGKQFLELSNEDELKCLTFNEDLQARPWWSPTPDVNFLSEPFEEGCLQESLHKHEADEKKAIMRKVIERKSLVPRLVYVSIQSAPSSLKEYVEPNGTLCDSNVVCELKRLLERYASSIGFSFDDVINMILEISKGQKSFKDVSPDVVSWMNFAVFFHAWNLCSHRLGLNEDGSGPTQWHIVESLIRTCISEQLMHAQPISTNIQSNLPVLVQLVTESFSWHILVIQSCMRSLLPCGKKKKKSGVADQLHSPHLKAIHGSILCLSDAIQAIQKWLADQINRPEDQDLDSLLSHVLVRDREEGPSRVFHILEENASLSNSELGQRISGALRSWNSASVVRKIIRAQRKLLSEFHRICDSKLKLLESLRRST